MGQPLILTKDECCGQKDKYLSMMKQGSVFIYPTDTIYGIGCNAMVDSAVHRIRDIKSRFTRPFSIIVPSIKWIYEYCEVPKEAEEWIEKLPGPYTIILKLKDVNVVSPYVLNGADSVGIRIPEYWFSKIVAEIGYPIVTTSANHVGEDFMTSIETLASDIKDKIDFIVYEGEIDGRPSQIINCSEGKVCITNR